MIENSSSEIDDSQASATRRRIIEAATLEFAEFGYAGARINRIAAEAAANKQLIYRYFGGKHELYVAVFVEMTRSSRALLSEEKDSGLAYLQFLISHESGLDSNSEFPLWARLLGWEGVTNATLPAQIEELRKANFRSRRDWIRSDQSSGEISPEFRPELVHALLMAASIFPVTMPRTFRYILDADEITDGDLREWFDFVTQLVAGNKA